MPDDKDGCELDFKEAPETTAEEVAAMLVPEGEEEETEDA